MVKAYSYNMMNENLTAQPCKIFCSELKNTLGLIRILAGAQRYKQAEVTGLIPVGSRVQELTPSWERGGPYGPCPQKVSGENLSDFHCCSCSCLLLQPPPLSRLFTL